MFTFYKVDAVGEGWHASFLNDGKITYMKNDKGALEFLLSNTKYLVGFNNYQMDDKILASIIRDLDLSTTLPNIKDNKFRMAIQNPITLDVAQELRNLSIEEVELNLLKGISNRSIKQKLHDQVHVIKEVFEKRESYFSSKFEIVQDFELKAEQVKLTRANLAARVLKSRKKTDKDRLNIWFDERLRMSEIPNEVVVFYESIMKKYKDGADYKELERERFLFKMNGLDHVYGFGGLHAAKEKYVGNGNYMQIDISSYYPSLILNNGLIDNLKDYQRIYDLRMQLKKEKNPKEEVYKVLLNSVYGSMKNKYSDFYNPQAGNIVAVNGQLILTNLILVLGPFCELVQSNTDGIIIKYNSQMKSSILEVIKLFEKQYQLDIDIDYIKRIAQRDVNNYMMVMQDDSIIARGVFARYTGGGFERNNMTILDESLVKYFVDGIRPNRTIMQAYKDNEFHKFQSVVKAGSFDGMAIERKEETLFEGSFTSEFDDVEDTNRVFASRSEKDGAIYRVRKGREKQYVKTAHTSDNVFISNGAIDETTRRRINLNWYIRQANKLMF